MQRKRLPRAICTSRTLELLSDAQSLGICGPLCCLGHYYLQRGAEIITDSNWPLQGCSNGPRGCICRMMRCSNPAGRCCCAAAFACVSTVAAAYLQAAGVDEEAEGNAATGAAVAAVNAPREVPCLNAWPLQNQVSTCMAQWGHELI